MKVIYLDENATATPSRVASEMASEWLRGPAANASSVHSRGRRARGAIEESRRHIAASLGVSSRHLTFTSGATEALHTLIGGVLSSGDHVLVSAVEHPAVWGALEGVGAEVEVIPVDAEGRVNPTHFGERCRESTKLAIMMAAQNEIGTIYPVRAIASQLGQVPLLVDAVQAYGKVKINLEETGATFAVISGHKIGAPQGAGVIWARGGAPFQPLLLGGAQERGRRAGTENVAAIVGLGVAAKHLESRLAKMKALRPLREELRGMIKQFGAQRAWALGAFTAVSSESDLTPSWLVHGQLPNTLAVLTPQQPGDLLLQRLDLAGFCLSSGSACSSGALEPSPVVRALGRSEDESSKLLRVSMGVETDPSDIEQLIAHLDELI